MTCNGDLIYTSVNVFTLHKLTYRLGGAQAMSPIVDNYNNY